MHIPANMSFEEAATLPCGLATVALALYKHLSLPLPTFPTVLGENKDGRAILIYGGSTATGTLAIQFAKLFVLFPVYPFLIAQPLRNKAYKPPDLDYKSSPPPPRTTFHFLKVSARIKCLTMLVSHNSASFASKHQHHLTRPA
jgi:hypothetical protein